MSLFVGTIHDHQRGVFIDIARGEVRSERDEEARVFRWTADIYYRVRPALYTNPGPQIRYAPEGWTP